VYWNDTEVDREQLAANVAVAAQQQPQPELHLQVERTAAFETVAQVMAAAQAAGLEKIGFVTDARKQTSSK
jgi:biopolymer transport protein ExbD